MAEAYADTELVRLTAEAKMIDEQLAGLQLSANASNIGSVERREYSELGDESAAAWQHVLDRVMVLMSLSNDLRQPLPEEEA